MKPLRIVMVMVEPPLPFGAAVGRWYYPLFRGLVERGHRVTAFAVCSNPADIDEAAALFPAPHYDLRCYPIEHRNGAAAKLETIRRPHSHLFGSEVRRDLADELGRGYDILHLETLWSGWSALEFDSAKAIVNLLYLYALDDANSAFVDIRTGLQRALRKRAERGMLGRFGTIAGITPRLANAARELTRGKVPVHYFPFAVDSSLYKFEPGAPRPSQPVVTTIGSMTWRPSLDAAVRLLTRLWPGIKREVPDAKLRIVGRTARSMLREFVGLADVEIIENVPDAAPYFKNTSVMVHASDHASGVRVKIVDAMAFGAPVVTNAEGTEGLPVRDGVHLAVAPDERGIVEQTVALLGNVEAQQRMRLAARQLIETQLAPSRALDAVEACYQEMIARSGGAATNSVASSDRTGMSFAS